MIGGRPHADADSVRAAWDAHAARSVRLFGGFPNRPVAEGLDDRRKDVSAAAYVSDGRWVADCPVCAGGVAVWPHGMRDACCFDCGTLVSVSCPPASVVGAAVAVLRHRPTTNQHWVPGVESVDDLKAENLSRGYLFVEAV